jgi:hypothetical protein
MTRAQKTKHNKEIKNIYFDYIHFSFKSLKDQESEQYQLRSRLHALYFADVRLVHCTLESLRIMLWLNYKFGEIKTFPARMTFENL